MKEFPRISDAEWQVMKVVWAKSLLNASEIIEALKPDTTWNPKTIHTLISRLVNKEALGVNKDTSFYMYFPLVSEEECKRVETKSFLQKVYDGSLNMLVANFIKNEKLSCEELEELRRLLNDKK